MNYNKTIINLVCISIIIALNTNVMCQEDTAENIPDQNGYTKENQLIDPKIKEELSQECIALVIKGDETSEFGEKINIYSEALEISPNSSSLYIKRGIANAKNGNIEKAIEDFNSACIISPNDPLPITNRAFAKILQGKLAEAIRDYDSAIKLNANEPYFYNSRAYAYYLNKDFESAISDYSKAIELAPNVPLFYFNLGKLLKELGKDTEAEKNINKYIELANNQNGTL
ncbi:MAG: TPR protein [uncultured bacterium]|nr:MAG: TPR protein [uncultured bacterium]